MATSPEIVRTKLAEVSEAATQDLLDATERLLPERRVAATLQLLPLVVPSYYNASGALAVAWYAERRDEANPRSLYLPSIVGESETDWIEREVAEFRTSLDAGDLETESRLLLAETVRLAEKEVARGFRSTVVGNSRNDEDSIGWSRVARGGACKFCRMLADRGAVYRESTASFSAHKSCNCAARPEFEGGEHGPEASVMQYQASLKNRTPEQREQVRAYLTKHYPDAPG